MNLLLFSNQLSSYYSNRNNANAHFLENARTFVQKLWLSFALLSELDWISFFLSFSYFCFQIQLLATNSASVIKNVAIAQTLTILQEKFCCSPKKIGTCRKKWPFDFCAFLSSKSVFWLPVHYNFIQKNSLEQKLISMLKFNSSSFLHRNCFSTGVDRPRKSDFCFSRFFAFKISFSLSKSVFRDKWNVD